MNFTYAGSCSAGTEDPLKNSHPINIPSQEEWSAMRIDALLAAIASGFHDKRSVCEEHLTELSELLEKNEFLC